MRSCGTGSGRRPSALGVALLASACSPASAASGSSDPSGTIVAVGAENEYANVIQQVGGKYVQASADHEQPEHRPAHLRGQRRRWPGR